MTFGSVGKVQLIGLTAAAVYASCAFGTDTLSGERAFQRFCAECHAPGFGHPGTQRLGWSRGEASAVLESRKDLRSAYVTFVVRHGLAEMPAFRPTEITDDEVAQIATYLETHRKSAGKP